MYELESPVGPAAWFPSACVSEPTVAAVAMRASWGHCEEEMSLYAQGALALDQTFYINAPLQEYLALARTGEEKIRFPWEDRGYCLGGSPAHAIRVGSAKGIRTYLGARLPRNLPPIAEQFISEHRVDTSFVKSGHMHP